MSWFQLKKSPPDPRALSNIKYNDSDTTRNNESNNMRNYNMNDNDNYINRALQQRIETHLLPSYIPQQQQFHISSSDRQQNRSSNTYSNDYHHPSYRNYEITFNDSNSFFDYNNAGRKKKLPILSPIETSKMNSLRMNENIQQHNKEQPCSLPHRSQIIEYNTRSGIENHDNVIMSGIERNNCNSNDRTDNGSDSFNGQLERRSKKKKYSRLEIVQNSNEENYNRMADNDQLAANKMSDDTIMEDNNMNNVVLNVNSNANQAKSSDAISLADKNDRQQKKKTRSKKQKAKDSSKENSKRTKAKKKTSNTNKLQSTLVLQQQKQQQQQPRIRSKKYQLMTKDMFKKIDQCGIFNAGFSNESLDAFLDKIQNATEDYIAWTIIFYDQNLTTTSFEPICKKYCTPKKKCMNWNCTCDGQIRSVQVGKPLFGALFNACCPNNGGIEKMCFILPLGPTEWVGR